jgi:DNA topoisomerase VI subunit B
MSIALPVAKRGATAPIARETFRTSRLMDFFSEKELTAQIGHGPQMWPLVVIKELMDNAIDACEDRGTAPTITVEIDETGITIADDGPGIAPDTVADILDYSVRVSSREAYVSPCRGAQGNALKTLVAMPYVLSGEQGTVEIDSRGVLHQIQTRVDRLRQVPKIDRAQTPGFVRNGTRVALHWPERASSILQGQARRILQMLEGFAALNPHLTLTGSVFGVDIQHRPTAPDWAKWKPSEPTSAHWYTADALGRLVAALIAHDEDHGRPPRLVRELVVLFKGLAGTAKQKAVLEATGLARQPLTALVRDGAIDQAAVARLLAAMQAAAPPIKPQHLGTIGKDHLSGYFAAAGCEMESFKYVREMEIVDGVPCVIEMGFAWNPSMAGRRLIAGVNWSPGILNPFREIGALGRGLDAMLSDRFASPDEPIMFLVHLAAARVAYSDRGKSAVLWEK